MFRYSLTFTTVHPVTQEQARELWAAGDQFDTVSKHVYKFEGAAEAEDYDTALRRGEQIIRETIDTPRLPNVITIIAVAANFEEVLHDHA